MSRLPTSILLVPEDAIHMPQDALGPRLGVGKDRLSTRANAVLPKILIEELLLDENPGDDCYDALATFVHGSDSTHSPFVPIPPIAFCLFLTIDYYGLTYGRSVGGPSNQLKSQPHADSKGAKSVSNCGSLNTRVT